MQVFVVQSEFGEYSDKFSWISGVYVNREDAEHAIADAAVKRRAYTGWWNRVQDKWPYVQLGHFQFPLNPEQKAEHDAITARAEEAAGPKPEYEPAEVSEIFEMEMGVWQSQIPEALEKIK